MSVVIFKPDDIGDFVIATGSIRALAREHGEENTTLVVKSTILPLARREFPRAKFVELPWQPRRKGHNQAAANIRSCFPAWRQLRRIRADLCVCLRSRRDFLLTFLFAAPRVQRRVAPENVLLRNGRWRRRLAEAALVYTARPVLVPYPSFRGNLPHELAVNRAVIAAALEREPGEGECMPSLASGPWQGGEGWLLCPFSSRPAKDYSAQRWASALVEAQRFANPRIIRLAGGPDQAARLHDFVGTLRAAGVSFPLEVLPPAPLEGFADRAAAADLILTVDTAAAHFACAVRAPAVVVFCGLHNDTYGPYSTDGRQIWLTGDWAGRGRDGWQDTVPPSLVAGAIRQALAA